MSTYQCRKCGNTDVVKSEVSGEWPPRVKFMCTDKKCGFWWTAPSHETMNRQIQTWRNQAERGQDE